MELIIALAVMGILGALATPTFSYVLLDGERSASLNRFFHALFLARSESMKRGKVVSLCKSTDGSHCNAAADWNDGWIVFVNADRKEPATRSKDEELIAAFEGWRNGSITSNRNTYSYRPHVQGVVNGTIIFCDRRGSKHARAIIISHTGRPRVAQRDSKGKHFACAA